MNVVHLRLICLAPPAGHDAVGGEFGLQDKAGQLHAGSRPPDGTLRYTFDLEAVGHDADDRPRWRGAYLHGTVAAPFCYLGWRRLDAGGATWLRRLKIPLATITRAQIEEAAEDGTLEATIGGDGSGTVPLLGGGWVVAGARHA